LVPIPPNQETVNILFGTNITTEEQMEAWLKERRPNLNGSEPKNGEEMSLSRVGKDLYEKVSKFTKHHYGGQI
jgi:UDP-galactopyranose mutase